MPKVKVPVSTNSAASIFKTRKAFALAPRRECHVNRCPNSPIRSHSISKNHLSLIETDGHLFTLSERELFDGTFIEYSNATVVKKVGIGDATTFDGFCSNHDNDLYQSIDKIQFDLTPNNLLLYAHRNFARQVSEHSSRVDQLKHFFSIHPPPPEPLRSAALRPLKVMELNLDYIRRGFRELSHTINTSKQQRFTHLVLETNARIGFAISTILFPTYSIFGDSYGRDVNGWPVSLTILPDANRSLILLTSRNHNYLASVAFLNSIETAFKSAHKNITSSCIAVAAIEGCPVFSQKWWDCLTLDQQEFFFKCSQFSDHENTDPSVLSSAKHIILDSTPIISCSRL